MTTSGPAPASTSESSGISIVPPRPTVIGLIGVLHEILQYMVERQDKVTAHLTLIETYLVVLMERFGLGSRLHLRLLRLYLRRG